MALHGDLSSYPLPELLQWLDSSRKTGALQLFWEAGDRRLFILGGQIVATASPSLWERMARAIEQGGIADGQRLMLSLKASNRTGVPIQATAQTLKDLQELTAEELYGAIADLTQAQAGRFHWSEDPDRGEDEWVAVEIPLRHAVFESLRWLDEASDVERVLPLDSMVVRSMAPTSAVRSALHRVLMHACSIPDGMTLGRLRLVLGLQKGMVARGVYELMRGRLVEVDGAGPLEADPVADMLEKGAVLLRERQFEAAGLVFSALLQSDPSDRRVREFARMVEREHMAALYRDLPPLTVLDIEGDVAELAPLRQEERQVAALINGKWDVTAVVLASQQRELDTLKVLYKLRRMGLLREVTPRQTEQ
jgi:hypothetical protein